MTIALALTVAVIVSGGVGFLLGFLFAAWCVGRSAARDINAEIIARRARAESLRLRHGR